MAVFDMINARKEEIEGGASYIQTDEDKEVEREQFFTDMQSTLGMDEFLGTCGDLAYSIYGVMWAYQSDYFYWHLGMYLGRAIADTYIALDWVLNFSALQPYWNVAFAQYKEGHDAWEEMSMTEEDVEEEEEEEEEGEEGDEVAEEVDENGDPV